MVSRASWNWEEWLQVLETYDGAMALFSILFAETPRYSLALTTKTGDPCTWAGVHGVAMLEGAVYCSKAAASFADDEAMIC